MSQAISPRIYSDLIGKRFASGARGPAEFDCVGLAIEFHRRRGFELPAFLSDEASLHRAIAAGGPLSQPHQLAGPEPGCCVLMRSQGGPGRHLGCMVDRYRMIHASEPVGSTVLEVLSRSVWGRRVLGYYRIEGAA
jgi:cell wall-associated NlpC family hydrolase